MRVHTEKAAFTFSRVNWEVSFQGPFFKVVESLLDSVISFQLIRGGGPDGKIITYRHRVSDWFPGGGARPKSALRNTVSDSERAASNIPENYLCFSV